MEKGSAQSRPYLASGLFSAALQFLPPPFAFLAALTHRSHLGRRGRAWVHDHAPGHTRAYASRVGMRTTQRSFQGGTHDTTYEAYCLERTHFAHYVHYV